MTIDATNDAREQVKAQLEGILEMLARLKHAESCDASEPDECELAIAPNSLFEMELTRQYTFSELHDADAASDAIREDALDVQVRSGWTNPGETLEPAEFNILLCTGGPAVRIMGELDNYGNPERAWLEYQDWGTPWTKYYAPSTDGGLPTTLLEYASHYLGY